jgi:hypothetical protein
MRRWTLLWVNGVIVALDRAAPNYYDTCKFHTVGQEPVLVAVVCETTSELDPIELLLQI